MENLLKKLFKPKNKKMEYEGSKQAYIESKFNKDIIKKRCNPIGGLNESMDTFIYFIEDYHGDYNEYILNNSTEDIVSKFKSICGCKL